MARQAVGPGLEKLCGLGSFPALVQKEGQGRTGVKSAAFWGEAREQVSKGRALTVLTVPVPWLLAFHAGGGGLGRAAAVKQLERGLWYSLNVHHGNSSVALFVWAKVLLLGTAYIAGPVHVFGERGMGWQLRFITDA